MKLWVNDNDDDYVRYCLDDGDYWYVFGNDLKEVLYLEVRKNTRDECWDVVLAEADTREELMHIIKTQYPEELI